MNRYTLRLREIDKTEFGMVGGKGANLGELAAIETVKVPGGFCVTTLAYKDVVEDNELIASLTGQLKGLKADDRKTLGNLGKQIRDTIENIPIPDYIVREISGHLKYFGERNPYAVRSSATAEDLPSASFAGQQDTYLNVIGETSILRHVSKCWASLFTDRAIIYRIQNGFDHSMVQLSVVIQEMVLPQASGIMFTADPVSGNRKVTSIDASFGLGEALVSGIVNADVYKIASGRITEKKVSNKKIAIYAVKGGGTKKQEIPKANQDVQALSDEQILQLEKIGRRIESHFGTPQDIEWCLADDGFQIVQSRPITTLFPVPQVNDQQNHVFISVGHQQMMTDAMKPLGLSFWLLTTPAVMHKAGGRLFVDVTQQLTSMESRNGLLNAMGHHDPLIKDALTTIVEREDFLMLLPDKDKGPGQPVTSVAVSPPPQVKNDPKIVSELIGSYEQSLARLKQEIQSKSGPDLFDFIQEDLRQLHKSLFDPKSMGVIMTAINASIWINQNMLEWLGEKNAADTISLSVSNNVTSEMGLALLDVADVVRRYPAVAGYLEHATGDDFLNDLASLDGGRPVQDAIHSFLNKYGMRCAGEIDITRSRWSEKPSTLLPVVLGNVKNFDSGESKRKFEQGRSEALRKEAELLERLKSLPDGDKKAAETKEKIDLIRNFSGYREYPKYNTVSRYFVYKLALLNEADRLVQAGVVAEKEDVYYLTFEEFREVSRTQKLDRKIVDKRKEDFKEYEGLTPPRVITSDGEILKGEYKRENIPGGALVGLPVSTGVIEGRARVILNMEDAVLEDGDILVTSFTDPSWTPLFVSIKGLVTEVGGLMTHGAVIAREYGIPAVVGVENAARLIKDGQRIRVNGTDGYVEIL